MKTCPYCAEQIQNEAIKCRYCGEWLDGRQQAEKTSRVLYSPYGYGWNYEYKSEAEILGWPLIHIAQGINPETGAPRVAKGVIAIGNFAIGGLAIGGLAAGGVTLGGLGLGMFSFCGSLSASWPRVVDWRWVASLPSATRLSRSCMLWVVWPWRPTSSAEMVWIPSSCDCSKAGSLVFNFRTAENLETQKDTVA